MNKYSNIYNKFLLKNYDVYILCFLILFSFTITLLDYFYEFVPNLPCFIAEQEDFIQDASFNINNLLPPGKSFDPLAPKRGVLVKIIVENILGFVLIMGIYGLLKWLFFHKKKWEKIVLILLLFYSLVILYSSLVMPIVGCIIKIG